MHTPPVSRAVAPTALLFLGLIASALPVSAGIIEKWLHKDVDVLTVTDVTEAGRARPAASPERPVRYKLVYLGEQNFGQSWAGERLPAKRDIIRWMIESLKPQGYLLAEDWQPPEVLLVFSWGLLSGGEGRPALNFLGGDRVNLAWENETQYGGFVNPNVLRRGIIRTGIAGKVWDLTESNLYLGLVRAYTIDSETAPQPTLLWETRFGCPALGLSLDETMPTLIKSASLNFGRETIKPVNLNATDHFGSGVTMGELEVLGEVLLPAPPAPKPESH